MPLNPVCADCNQDLIRDCAEHFRLTQPCLVRTLRRLEAAANYVGIDTPALIEMLQAGVSLKQVLDVIQARLAIEERESRSAA